MIFVIKSYSFDLFLKKNQLEINNFSQIRLHNYLTKNVNGVDSPKMLLKSISLMFGFLRKNLNIYLKNSVLICWLTFFALKMFPNTFCSSPFGKT